MSDLIVPGEYLDTDGDGYAETAIADTDGDGYVDTVLTDVTGDGYADVAEYDRNAEQDDRAVGRTGLREVQREAVDRDGAVGDPVHPRP